MKIRAKKRFSLLTMLLLIFSIAICFASLFSQKVLAQSQIDENQKTETTAREDDIKPIFDPNAPLPYKYCGNSCSMKFHRFSCPFGEAISKRHLVLFHFRHEAIEAHYLPCRYCLPPVWCKVHGVLLPRNQKDSAENSPVAKEHLEENDNHPEQN